MFPPAAEEFLGACGVRENLTLGVTNGTGEEPKSILLGHPFAMLGRCDLADVVLAEPDVSWWHAYVQLLDGAAYLLDLGSEAGTAFDGNGARRGWLRPGQLFRVGAHHFHVPTSLATPPAYSPVAANSSEHYATLEIVNHPKGRRVPWPLNRPLTLVGKSLDCKVRLRCVGIAPFHCCFVSTPGGIWVVDLCRRPGMKVNGQSCKFACVRHGDEVQVGVFSLYLHDHARSQSAVSQSGVWLEPHGHDIRTIQLAPSPAGGTSPPVAEPRELAGPVKNAAAGSIPSDPPAPFASPISQQGALSLFTARRADTSTSLSGGTELLQTLLMPVVSHFHVVQQQMFDQFHQTLMMFFGMFGGLFKEQHDLIREEIAEVQKLTEELERLRQELATAPATPARDSRSPNGVVAARAESETSTSEGSQATAPPKDNAASASTASVSEEARADVHSWICQRIDRVLEERRSRWQKIVGFFTRK